jgi:hypothetical protein
MTVPTVDIPPVLTQLQTQLAEAGAVDGITSGHIHYPTCNVQGAAGTIDPIPALLIDTLETGREVIGDGLSVLTGEAEVILYAPAAIGTAGVEAMGDRILAALAAATVGLVWTGLSRGNATEPSCAAQAAHSAATPTFRSLTLRLSFGVKG